MVGCVAMRDGDADARSHRRKVRLQRQSPEGFTDGKAQDPITLRCGECMSCRRALRRRGAWRGAATTSALGSRWQRAPSARRRRPRSRQGGEVHGVARCESAGTSRPRRNLGVVGEPKKGRGDRGPPLLGGADMSLHIVSMCQNSRANRDSSHLAEDSFTEGTDTTKPESPSLPSPIIFPSCAQVL